MFGMTNKKKKCVYYKLDTNEFDDKGCTFFYIYLIEIKFFNNNNNNKRFEGLTTDKKHYTCKCTHLS